ncbi:hypothetical protein MJT46_009732 [Ovis ammon polii x Ovis aries]|nr:hypothetical protein MJT46_009732 [Ovis ammon polii x Ovis aries]
MATPLLGQPKNAHKNRALHNRVNLDGTPSLSGARLGSCVRHKRSALFLRRCTTCGRRGSRNRKEQALSQSTAETQAREKHGALVDPRNCNASSWLLRRSILKITSLNRILSALESRMSKDAAPATCRVSETCGELLIARRLLAFHRFKATYDGNLECSEENSYCSSSEYALRTGTSGAGGDSGRWSVRCPVPSADDSLNGCA